MNPDEIQKEIIEIIEKLEELMPKWAKSKADKNYSDDMKKVQLSLAMSKSDAKTNAAKEQEAYASQEYKDYLFDAFKVDCIYYQNEGTKNTLESKLDALRSLLSFVKTQDERIYKLMNN